MFLPSKCEASHVYHVPDQAFNLNVRPSRTLLPSVVVTSMVDSKKNHCRKKSLALQVCPANPGSQNMGKARVPRIPAVIQVGERTPASLTEILELLDMEGVTTQPIFILRKMILGWPISPFWLFHKM